MVWTRFYAAPAAPFCFLLRTFPRKPEEIGARQVVHFEIPRANEPGFWGQINGGPAFAPDGNAQPIADVRHEIH